MFTTEEETETTAREFRMMKAANVSGKLPMVDFYLMRIITATMIILHRPEVRLEVADIMDIRLCVESESDKNS